MGPPNTKSDQRARSHTGDRTRRRQSGRRTLGAQDWRRLSRGGCFGSAIVGFRADGAIIDDPVRSREDADSKIIRDKTWEWYQSDLTTRLKPGGFKVLIQTRWHEDDLAGRILTEADRTGEPWEVISLAAEARENDPLGREPGEMLWADDDAYGYMRGCCNRRNPPSHHATGLRSISRTRYRRWQLFRGENGCAPHTQMPPKENLHIYGASDFAVTQDGGDWTVHVIVGVDQNDKMYLLDLYRRRTSTDQWIDAWCDLVRKWKPFEWGFEGGQIKSSVGPFLERRARERKAYCSHKTFPPLLQTNPCKCLIHSWPHGNGRPLRPHSRPLVPRLSERGALLPCGQTRRSGRLPLSHRADAYAHHTRQGS